MSEFLLIAACAVVLILSVLLFLFGGADADVPGMFLHYVILPFVAFLSGLFLIVRLVRLFWYVDAADLFGDLFGLLRMLFH